MLGDPRWRGLVIAPTCAYKLGPAPACGEPATGRVHLSLPEFVAEGVRIADDQRELDLDVCAEHERIIASFGAGPDVFSAARVPASMRAADLPIEAEHARHTAYVAGCLGCAFDYAPPW